MTTAHSLATTGWNVPPLGRMRVPWSGATRRGIACRQLRCPRRPIPTGVYPGENTGSAYRQFGWLQQMGFTMIVLGIVLLVVGYFAGISILYTIGGILVVVGIVLWILGAVGRPVGGRKVWF